MKLIPLENDDLIGTVAGWLADEANYRWLDFGGVQRLDALKLKIMAQRGKHLLRVFTADDGSGVPIGIVAFDEVNESFKTALLWIVLGDRRYSNKGYAYRAVSAMLALGFGELGLRVVNVWAVDCNHASLRAIRRLGFKPIGRQRRCHYIDGQAHDRLWFDMLAEEYAEAQRG